MRRIDSIDKRALRQQLCHLFGGRCAYCTWPVGMRGTIDHYVPQSLGGTDGRANLRWACIRCNRLKANMPPADWEMRIPQLPRPGETRSQRKVRLIAAAIQRHRQPAATPAEAPAPAL